MFLLVHPGNGVVAAAPCHQQAVPDRYKRMLHIDQPEPARRDLHTNQESIDRSLGYSWRTSHPRCRALAGVRHLGRFDMDQHVPDFRCWSNRRLDRTRDLVALLNTSSSRATCR